MLPFAYILAVIAVLEDYFGDTTQAIVKDNFDLVLQVRPSSAPFDCAEPR